GSPLITGSNQYLTLDHAITADGQTLVQEVNDSHMAESDSSKSARVGTRKNQDYDVLSFGARNDGITLNTNIIQAAIDFISEHGGGRLIFPPGRYVSGSIY